VNRNILNIKGMHKARLLFTGLECVKVKSYHNDSLYLFALVSMRMYYPTSFQIEFYA
jgi:nicotinamide riboside transporter PnuC